MDLAGYLASYRAVILVDTVCVPAEPGAVVRYEKSSLMEDFASLRLSPHDPAVAQSLFLAELTAQAPACVVLIGIVPQTIGLGEAMSPAARRGCSIASESVLVDLARWGVAASPKDCRTEARVWWELQPKVNLPFVPAATPVQKETCP
jgi:hydrogenase maturation protease